jgi:NAD(P)-dependent dehydrogenase (short-subunit alcohol dehydrogenase family)
MRVEGKVAIVVGGGSGIGKAISKLLAQEGARVMVADIDTEAAKAVATEIRLSGFQADSVIVDMTKEADAIVMAQATIARFGKIDILANVAGGSVGKYIREKFRPFPESTKEEWDKIVDVNLNGARNCTRAVINHMVERKSGKIVSFSSAAGVTGAANAVDYSAAKAGIIGFTKALALEMAPYGIQVNCISPTGVLTERIAAFAKSTAEKNPGQKGMDLTKLTLPEEVANVVLLLVSDEVNHLSGHNVIFP